MVERPHESNTYESGRASERNPTPAILTPEGGRVGNFTPESMDRRGVACAYAPGFSSVGLTVVIPSCHGTAFAVLICPQVVESPSMSAAAALGSS